MAGQQDRAFPLLDRPTPLVDRLRENNAEGGADFGEQAAAKVSQFVKNDNPEVAAAEFERLVDSFGSALADELGVEEDEISPEALEAFMGLLDMDEDNLIKSDDDEEEESTSSFSSSDE